MTKSSAGNFFEDFRLGQEIHHATPRTVTAGDQSLYIALTGNRFALHGSASFAAALGHAVAPVDDLLAFHIVFGKTVPDVSLNAIANLGYAECRFLAPVYAGDTLAARSTVIGLRENASRDSGIVYVRTAGTNQRGEPVMSFVRWVMVRKRDRDAPAPTTTVPALADSVAPGDLVVPGGSGLAGYDYVAAGSKARWGDYSVGEKIDHVDGLTIEEAEHMTATRLYQNTARIHFNKVLARSDRFARRVIYGGHVISLARALSFNGLANAFRIAAINSGRHANPCFAGDTVFAWSEVLDMQPLARRRDVGALRLRLVAVKDRPADEFPLRTSEGYDPAVLLDLDYWVLMPR
jgi:2-methylfumaryl-CoA hydratase